MSPRKRLVEAMAPPPGESARHPPVEIVYPKAAAVGYDSIASHGHLLAGALSTSTGYRARHVTLTEGLGAVAGPARHIVIQYNPFSYGRWGIAPRLLGAVARLQRRCGVLALLVHEAYVPIHDGRSLAIGSWQRAQLFALCRSVDLVIGVSEERQRSTRRFVGDEEVHHLPAGSNLPDARTARSDTRASMQVSDATIVLAQIGTSHPSRLDAHGPAAAAALVEEGHEVVLLNLGAHAPTPPDLPGVRLITPGRLSDAALAEAIAAADIFLSPCADGVTTRRTSLMAALQQGVPVVGTVTPGTDRVLREAEPALSLAPVADLGGFIELVRALADGPSRRCDAAKAARELYEKEFAWPVIARRFASILAAAERS